MSLSPNDSGDIPSPSLSSATRFPLLAAAPYTGGPSRARSAYHEPRQAGKNACCHCRTKKIKCSGDRPACGSCQNKHVECVYAAEPGERPAQANKRRLREIDQEVEAMRQKMEELESLVETQAHELSLLKRSNDKLRENNRLLAGNLTIERGKESADQSSDINLLRLIKISPRSELPRLVDRYREGEDPGEIVRSLQENNPYLPTNPVAGMQFRSEFPYVAEMPTYLRIPSNEYLGSTIYRATYQSGLEYSDASSLGEQRIIYESPYVKPYVVATLVEERLTDVDIQRWTRVKCSNDTLIHLLKVYFLYEHGQHTFFHKDYFLDDLQSGSVRNAQHCSSLLVNAVLVAACHCHSGFKNRARSFEDPQSLAYQFMAEARNLYDLEKGRYKLTTMQAAFILDVELSIQGKSTVGLAFKEDAIAMLLEQRRVEQSQPPLSELSPEGAAVRHAREFSDWCSFAGQAMTAFYFKVKPWIQHPPTATLFCPKTHHAWYGETWVHYPGDHTRTPSQFGYCLRARLQLYTIFNQIQWEKWVTEPIGTLTLRQAQGFYEELRGWFEELSLPNKPKNIVWPAQLRLHMEYHSAVIQLFEAHIARDGPDNNNNGSSASKQHIAQSDIQRCRELVTYSRLMLETVARLYYLRHSYQTYDPMLIQILAFLDGQIRRTQEENDETASMSRLRTADPRTADFQLATRFLCFRGLYDQAQISHQAAFLFDWMVRNEISPAQFELCRAMTDMVDDIKVDTKEIRSEWVKPSARDGEDLKVSTMDALRRTYEDMSLRRLG